MLNEEKYSCMRDLGAKVLLFITSYIILFVGMCLYVQKFFYNRSRNINKKELITDEGATFVLSSAYALFLPLMSYMYSQAKEYELEERAKTILTWMVLIEIIRVHDDTDSTFELRKSLEQLVRLFWVGFLVSSYTPLQGMRVNLLILCSYSIITEVLKAIMFNVGNDSCLIGNNPKLIHNYVKRIMVHRDLRTTPMNACNYIVAGEENHHKAVCSNGYHLGDEKSNTEGMLTIGRVFQLAPSEDEVFTSRYPSWRDICLSHALAKMLRRRFAKLSVDEAGCKKALDFVLEGLIDYIGNNRDIQTSNNGERNSMERVFTIIQEELKLVYDFLQIKAPTYFYFPWYCTFTWIGILIMYGNYFHLSNYTRMYTGEQKISSTHCLVGGRDFSFLDGFITYPLLLAYIYIPIARASKLRPQRWSILRVVKTYIKDPAEWIRSNKSLRSYKVRQLLRRPADWIKQCRGGNVKEDRVWSSLLDAPAETVLFCVKVDVTTLARLPKWIRRIIPKSFPNVVHSSDAKVAILWSLRNSDGRLTNGEASLRNHQMEDLKWACQPNDSTTEAILIWHIATTLLHNQKPSPDLHQEPAPAPEQNNNTSFKNQEVALALSSYCHYLVEYLPELLPDEVESTEEIYESVRKEILTPPQSCCQKVRKNDRCNYLLQTLWGESSVVGKGVKLANNLMDYAENGKPVWTMLADFWAEMMLFIAPSDNVEDHKKILDREELITQIWALLTHAGIVTRPKPTEHQDLES